MEQKGYRILSLDGGGSRGIITVTMLKNLEVTLRKPLLECFDLICGTSTGGIIALALVSGMPLKEIESLYLTLPSEVFSSYFSPAPWYRYFRHGGAFFHDVSLLENLLKSKFKDKKLADTHPKCFVVTPEITSSIPSVYLLRNYPTPHIYNSQATIGNYFIPPENDCQEMKLWEAARATSAAPTFFEQFNYNSFQFVDGGMLANNPTELALQEIFATDADASIDYILSIGTGEPSMKITSYFKPPILKMAELTVNILTDSYRIHTNVLRWLGSACRGIRKEGPHQQRTRLLRWNPPLGTFALDINDKNTIQQMQQETEKYWESQHIQSAIAWLKHYYNNKELLIPMN